MISVRECEFQAITGRVLIDTEKSPKGAEIDSNQHLWREDRRSKGG